MNEPKKPTDGVTSNAMWHCREFSDDVAYIGNEIVVKMNPSYEADLTRRLTRKGFAVRRRSKQSDKLLALSFARA